eukprot:COSAG05_NODE_9445_length_623_cov_0.765267_2_plen_81_part_01
MYRVYSTQHDARSPLRKQMSSLSSSFVERSAETIKLRNDDLMSYHAIAVSLREFVEALLVNWLPRGVPVPSRIAVHLNLWW